MKQTDIISASGLLTLIVIGTILTKGSTFLMVFTFYLLILSLIGPNWKAAEKKTELNTVWWVAVKILAVLNLVFFGGLFISLVQMMPNSYFHLTNLKIPILVSILILLGNAKNNLNLRKTLIFFVWFDLVRWMLSVLTTQLWKKQINLSKIKFKIQIVNNKK